MEKKNVSNQNVENESRTVPFEWNVLVKSKDCAEEALKVLGNIFYPDNPNRIVNRLETYIKYLDNSDYITAIPVELSAPYVGNNRNPGEIAVISVHESDVNTLVSKFGYKVIIPEIPVEETVKVGDKEYKMSDLKKIVNAHENYEKAANIFVRKWPWDYESFWKL